VETANAGWNFPAGINRKNIKNCFYDFYPEENMPQIYGNGDAAGKIVQVIKTS